MPASLTIRYFAGARAAANGTSTEQAEADSLDDIYFVCYVGYTIRFL